MKDLRDSVNECHDKYHDEIFKVVKNVKWSEKYHRICKLLVKIILLLTAGIITE